MSRTADWILTSGLLTLLQLAGTLEGAAQQPARAQALNPDLSAIGDFLVDLSPRQARFTEAGERFAMRELELGIQAAVDPFFRADIFLAVHGGALEVEEAYLTALALPLGFQGKLGQLRLPLGKTNLTHRPELLTVEYPLALRSWFGPEGLSASGVALSHIFAPLGFFQEMQVYLVNGIQGGGHTAHEHGEEEEAASLGPGTTGITVVERERRGWEQVGMLAHLRNFHDLTSAANLEVGLSAAAGSVERYRFARPSPSTDATRESDATEALEHHYRPQRYYGVNAIFRWRPPERGLYRSFRWEAEAFVHDGPESRVWAGFTQSVWQVGRRSYLGARLDAVQHAGTQEVVIHTEGTSRHTHLETMEGGEWVRAGSGWVSFHPSEFTRFRFTAERTFGPGWEEGGVWRAVLQTTFSLGPHRPHPF